MRERGTGLLDGACAIVVRLNVETRLFSKLARNSPRQGAAEGAILIRSGLLGGLVWAVRGGIRDLEDGADVTS